MTLSFLIDFEHVTGMCLRTTVFDGVFYGPHEERLEVGPNYQRLDSIALLSSLGLTTSGLELGAIKFCCKFMRGNELQLRA